MRAVADLRLNFILFFLGVTALFLDFTGTVCCNHVIADADRVIKFGRMFVVANKKVLPLYKTTYIAMGGETFGKVVPRALSQAFVVILQQKLR